MMAFPANVAIPGRLPIKLWPKWKRERLTLFERYKEAINRGNEHLAREIRFDIIELDKKSRANAAAAEDGDGKDEKKE